MDDVIDIVNSANSDADTRMAEWERQEAARKKAANFRADVKLALRALGFLGFNAGLIAASLNDLIDPILGGAVLCLSCAWFGAHSGAWFQFRARKEDKWYG